MLREGQQRKRQGFVNVRRGSREGGLVRGQVTCSHLHKLESNQPIMCCRCSKQSHTNCGAAEPPLLPFQNCPSLYTPPPRTHSPPPSHTWSRLAGMTYVEEALPPCCCCCCCPTSSLVVVVRCTCWFGKGTVWREAACCDGVSYRIVIHTSGNGRSEPTQESQCVRAKHSCKGWLQGPPTGLVGR
jgi:hypothetical protein